jgi:hypothetical protein
MNQKVRKALEGSIKKWEKIVNGTGVDRGVENCPLCKIFYDTSSCVGCPVYEKTGAKDCLRTPYTAWMQHHWENQYDDNFKVFDSKSTHLAQAELTFLKSLLPKENK